MVFNPMDLTGRAVLVTGASSGLGRATAVLLSRLGARLCLIGRNPERLQEAVAALEGHDHEYLSFDLENGDQIPDMMAELSQRLAPLSGVVHSAGFVQIKPLRISRQADFEAPYRVHVVAASQLIRGLTRRGVSHPQGCSVVILGSTASVIGSAGIAAYCSAKAAVLGLVRTAALELAREGIRVNAVLPGYCDTALTIRDKQVRTAEQVKQMVDNHPLGIGRPEDVANAVAFLIADTGRWITGTGLLVDGGYTAH
jgi:NAD(P)-dependent dehydrogenase (short-subunit alcohol dehydrogenase family)